MSDVSAPPTVCVIAVDGKQLSVRHPQLNCGECATGRGCGAALLATRRSSSLMLWQQQEACPRPGDMLVPERARGVLNASALGYGAPLLGLLIGVSIGAGLGGDSAAIAGALVGTAVSLVSVRICVSMHVPRWRVIRASAS